jgi:hypothetical protein
MEASRQVGEGEAIARPSEPAKAVKTKIRALAVSAPAMIALQGRLKRRVSSMATSPQSEERQNEEDDDDQADEINDAIHESLLSAQPC